MTTRDLELEASALAFALLGILGFLLSTSSASGQATPGLAFVKGRIKSEFTRPREPLPGVELCNRQGDCVVTNRKGKFKGLPIHVDAANYPGYYKVIAQHDDCHAHEFWVRIRKARNRHQTTLWPESAVPLGCLNLQWRWLGWPETPNGRGGSIRWTSEPENIIVANRLQCLARRETSHSECVEFEALPELAVQGFRDRVRAFIARWPRFTRFLKGDRVRVVEHPPGTIFDLADILGVPQSITWMAVQGFQPNFAIRAWRSTGALLSVAVTIDSKYEDDDWYIHHEGWHALGAAHKGGNPTRDEIAASCPRGSILGWSGVVTEDDIATARAVYSRAPGSRRPDKDRNPDQLTDPQCWYDPHPNPMPCDLVNIDTQP